MSQSAARGIEITSCRSKSIKMGCAFAPNSTREEDEESRKHNLLQLPSGARVRHETRGDATVFLRDGEDRLHLVFDTGEVSFSIWMGCA